MDNDALLEEFDYWGLTVPKWELFDMVKTKTKTQPAAGKDGHVG